MPILYGSSLSALMAQCARPRAQEISWSSREEARPLKTEGDSAYPPPPPPCRVEA